MKGETWIKPGIRVRIETRVLPMWSGQTGIVAAVNGPIATVRLDNIRGTSALFELAELKPAGA